MIGELAAIIVPVLFAAGIGYWWGRSGRPFDSTFVTRLVSDIGTPCLAFSVLTRLRLEPAAFGQFLLANVLVVALCAIGGLLALRLLRIPVRDGLPSVMFSNGGNMGLPLSFFAFGDAGLAFAVVYLAGNAVQNFTVGQAIAAGRVNWKSLLRTPVIWAVVAAVLSMLAEVEIPRWLANATRLLGEFAVPLMLLALGQSLARMRLGVLRKSAGIAGLRLALGFGAGMLVAWLLALDEPARGVLILQASMPIAVFNYLFASVHGSDHEAVAGAVILSTLGSFATLPFLLLYLLP